MFSQELPPLDLGGAKIFKGLLGRDAQLAMVNAVRRVVADAPLVGGLDGLATGVDIGMMRGIRQVGRGPKSHPLCWACGALFLAVMCHLIAVW